MKLSIFVALATLLLGTQATPVPAEGELNVLSARGLPNSQGVSGGFFYNWQSQNSQASSYTNGPAGRLNSSSLHLESH
jgi:hypothetical protein